MPLALRRLVPTGGWSRIDLGAGGLCLQVRPSPFLVRLRRDTLQAKGEMQIAVNARTLVNRALADLVHTAADDVTASWRIVEHKEAPGSRVFGGFLLKSNRWFASRPDRASSLPGGPSSGAHLLVEQGRQASRAASSLQEVSSPA